MNKCYKSIDEQIKYLETNKKIIVSQDERYIFEERNYSSLINPYKEFFSYGRDNEGNHIYKNEVDFKRILEIIKIDDNFSTIMYSYIGEFEKNLKVFCSQKYVRNIYVVIAIIMINIVFRILKKLMIF